MENELDKIKLELINLYLNIKIRTQEEVNSLTEEMGCYSMRFSINVFS